MPIANPSAVWIMAPRMTKAITPGRAASRHMRIPISTSKWNTLRAVSVDLFDSDVSEISHRKSHGRASHK